MIKIFFVIYKIIFTSFFFCKTINIRKENNTPEKLATISNNSKYRLGIHNWNNSKKKPRLNKNKNIFKNFLSEYARNPKILVKKYDRK